MPDDEQSEVMTSKNVPGLLLRVSGGIFVILGVAAICIGSVPTILGYIAGPILIIIGYLALRGRLVSAIFVGLVGVWIGIGGIVAHTQVKSTHHLTFLSTWQGCAFYIAIGSLFMASSVQAIIQRRRLKWF